MSLTSFVQKVIGFSDDDRYSDYDARYEEVDEGQDAPEHYGDKVQSEPYSDRTVSRLHQDTTTTPVNSKEQMNKKIVEMRGLSQINAEVMVIEPQSFEEMPKVIDALRERKSVVLNLDKMDPQEAQRSVDFVAGGTYAMDGHNERVGDSIFLFTPSCVTVSNLAGLISSADDFSTARVRPPAPRPVESWTEPTAAAQ